MLRRCFLRSLAVAPAAGLVHVPLVLTPEAIAQQRGGMAPAEPFKPSDEANSPMGAGKGIYAGRVAWVRDANATSWDGATGHWWDDASTDQKVVHNMTSRLVQDLTGRKNDKQAWDALFRNFNEVRRLGSTGYRPGEKIAIKVNCNQDRSPEWGAMASFPGGGPRGGGPPDAARGGGERGGPPPAGARGGGFSRGPQNGLPSPHAVAALVTQLIEAAGVRGEDIILYDVAGTRNVGQPIYTRIRANSNPQFQAVKFLVGADYNLGGRMFAAPDMANPIQFSKAEVPVAYLAQQVTAAKYMINMALLRPHSLAGVTLIGKNHFGSIHFPNNGGWSPAALHSYVSRNLPMGSYNPLVDLMGHRHLGGKTMLYVLDGLYTAEHNEGSVFKWASFGDHWASSMLMSQDPVAIDSVGVDMLRSEPRATQLRGNADNYLHEAAQAAKPPSGTVYNPDKSGVLISLGVHEHWNNSTDRKYSRNLSRKEGIELIASV
ncbi:MAG: DUF362 domain-containing protein [Bryobacteraceae bacterium]|jgi:uncharacterized protein (DUF362 family)